MRSYFRYALPLDYKTFVKVLSYGSTNVIGQASRTTATHCGGVLAIELQDSEAGLLWRAPWDEAMHQQPIIVHARSQVSFSGLPNGIHLNYDHERSIKDNTTTLNATDTRYKLRPVRHSASFGIWGTGHGFISPSQQVMELTSAAV